MDSLPFEIKQRICSLLSPGDLKPLRLSCKDFSVAANSYLLNRVFALHRPESFEALVEVARHPIFSRYVTTLVYNPCRLRTWAQYYGWFTFSRMRGVRIPRRIDFGLPPSADEPGVNPVRTRWVPPSHTLPPGWIYSSQMPAVHVPQLSDLEPLSDVEKTPAATAREERALRRAETRYQQALKDSLYTQQSTRDEWALYQKLHHLQSSENLEGLATKSMTELLAACSNLTNVIFDFRSPIESKTSQRRSTAEDIVYFSNQQCCEAAARDFSNHVLEVLSRELLQLGRTSTSLTLIHTPSSLMPKDSGVFKNLRHLRLTSQSYLESGLLDAIVDARSLETLQICTPSLTKLFPFGSLRFHSLRYCSLSGFRVTEDELVSFVLRHATTLEYLDLQYAHLKFGDWTTFSLRIAGRLPTLKQIRLVFLYAVPEPVPRRRTNIARKGAPSLPVELVAKFKQAIMHHGPFPEPVLPADILDVEPAMDEDVEVMHPPIGPQDDYNELMWKNTAR